MHILPINIWGNNQVLHENCKNKPQTLYQRTTPWQNKKKKKISNYLVKKQANLIDKNLLNIEK